MENKKIIGIALSMKMGWNLLFDSDSSDSEGEIETKCIPKTLCFFEDTVCVLNDSQFKSHFRVLPGTFEYLYQSILIIEDKYTNISPGHPRVTLDKQLLITLWYLANTECFRSVSDRFGVSINACWNAVFDICQQLLKVNHEKKIISWPSQERSREISNYFLEKTKFPGIIGWIDGSHIAIPAPQIYPNSYVNRKKYHSVLLQAVCDERAGSIHDSCLFRRSNLFSKISNGSLMIPPDNHMVGDLGYGLKSYLMTPFKDTGSLTDAHKAYNKAHSSARITIERAFGLLKCRFRRLTKLSTRRTDYIPLVIIASCNGDNISETVNISADDGSGDATSAQGDFNANLKRNEILRIIVA